MEYWSVENPFITPVLQHSITPLGVTTLFGISCRLFVLSNKFVYNFPSNSLDITIFSTSLVPSYISRTLAAR